MSKEGLSEKIKVEKLRLEAESLFAAVGEYQRQALGGPKPCLH
ncbi:hypothetical protein [Pseudomonas sp. TWI929]